MADINALEIHHDGKADVAAPECLSTGHTFVGKTPDGALAPAKVGIDFAWRMTRRDWAARR